MKTRPIAPPVQVSALFAVHGTEPHHESCSEYDNRSASLSISVLNDAMLTILHEKVCHAAVYDLADAADSVTLLMREGESITLLARRGGMIVACGVFEVVVGMVETAGAVLLPHCTHNLLIDQCEAGIVEGGITAALASIAWGVQP